MICLRCSSGLGALGKAPIGPLGSKFSPLNAPARRTFTSFTPLRPTIYPSAFRPSLAISKPSPNLSATTADAPLDLLPKISSHPALGATQVRCGPRNTFSPSHFVRKRRHGFLSRIRTRKGRAILTRRKLKRRSTLSH